MEEFSSGLDTPVPEVSPALKEGLKRVYQVANQPLSGGETPIKPLAFSEAPVEWLASLAAFTISMPLKMVKEGFEQMQEGMGGAGLLKGGPRGEGGEWTPAQYSEAMINLSSAGQAISGGMPGGAAGANALGIGRKPALKMMAKGVRDWLKPYSGKARTTLVEKIGPSYKELVRAVKHTPDEVLEPLTATQVMVGSYRPKHIPRHAAGTYEAAQQRISLDIGIPKEEVLNAWFHETSHGVQHLPNREFVESLGPVHERLANLKKLPKEAIPEEFFPRTMGKKEAHAYEFGDVAEAAVRMLDKAGKKMDYKTYQKLYKGTKASAEAKFGLYPPAEKLQSIQQMSYARRKGYRTGIEGTAEQLMDVAKKTKNITGDAWKLGQKLHKGEVKLGEVKRAEQLMSREIMQAQKSGNSKKYAELIQRKQYLGEATEFKEILGGSKKYPGKIDLLKQMGWLEEGF